MLRVWWIRSTRYGMKHSSPSNVPRICRESSSPGRLTWSYQLLRVEVLLRLLRRQKSSKRRCETAITLDTSCTKWERLPSVGWHLHTRSGGISSSTLRHERVNVHGCRGVWRRDLLTCLPSLPAIAKASPEAASSPRAGSSGDKSVSSVCSSGVRMPKVGIAGDSWLSYRFAAGLSESES